MTTPTITITPLRGTDQFILGMTREEVRALAGEPDAIERINIDEQNPGQGNEQQDWEYHRSEMTLSFCEDYDWRLSDITFYGSNALINGVALVGADEADLVRLCTEAGIPDVQLDESDDESGSCYLSDDAELMIWSVGGGVHNFTMFPEYDASGNVPIWPVR